MIRLMKGLKRTEVWRNKRKKKGMCTVESPSGYHSVEIDLIEPEQTVQDKAKKRAAGSENFQPTRQ